MDISSDYEDLFKILNTYKVRYLIVGAYAAAFYSQPRFTKDLDIWVDSDPGNAKRLYRALAEFGAPLKDLSPEDFTEKNMIYQIGVAPVRIDVLMGLPGLDFTRAWAKRRKSKYGRSTVNVLSRKDLIRSKRKIGREQDILDIKKLMRK